MLNCLPNKKSKEFFVFIFEKMSLCQNYIVKLWSWCIVSQHSLKLFGRYIVLSGDIIFLTVLEAWLSSVRPQWHVLFLSHGKIHITVVDLVMECWMLKLCWGQSHDSFPPNISWLTTHSIHSVPIFTCLTQWCEIVGILSHAACSLCGQGPELDLRNTKICPQRHECLPDHLNLVISCALTVPKASVLEGVLFLFFLYPLIWND